MQLLVFDIKGPMAHFRKFYTNSSSLTYDFPPRTVVTGIVASILGMKRDSYYTKLSSVNCHIAIQILTRTRKLTQTVNYIFVKNRPAEVTGSHGKPTQIPLEFLLPEPGERTLSFRVFFNHTDQKIMQNLKSCITENRYYFPVYLGITECIGYVEYVNNIEGIPVRPQKPKNIITISPSEHIHSIHFNEKAPLRYLKDKIVIDFSHDRRATSIKDVIYEAHGGTIQATTHTELISTPMGNLMFME